MKGWNYFARRREANNCTTLTGREPTNLCNWGKEACWGKESCCVLWWITLTWLSTCGFISQLVEHRTGIHGGHGFESHEALNFFQASFPQLHKLVVSQWGSCNCLLYKRVENLETEFKTSNCSGTDPLDSDGRQFLTFVDNPEIQLGNKDQKWKMRFLLFH